MALPYQWQWRIEKWKNAARGLFGGGGQPPRPKLCPACGSLVGINATRCHECGTNLRFSLASVSKSLAGTIESEIPVTTVVLIVNLVLFAVTLLASQASGNVNLFGDINGLILFRLGARQSIAILQGEVWRLVMPIFLHGSLLHIGMNSLFFVDLGPQVERLYGSARYFFIYMFTGISGFIVSTVWNLWTARGYGIGIGASGALAGLVGVMLAMTTKRGGSYAREIRSQMIRMVIYLVAMALLPFRIDNAAHFGGFAAGLLLGKILADREPMNPAEQKRAYMLGWLSGMVAVAALVMTILHFRDNLGP